MRALPDWSASLRHAYWQLRWCRVHRVSEIRKCYRRVKRERVELERRGLDAELLRLLCRVLVNPRNEAAELRFWGFYDSLALIRRVAIAGGMGAERPISPVQKIA